MKPTFLICLLFLFTFQSRSLKSQTVTLISSSDVVNYLNGTWDCFMICGGLAGTCDTVQEFGQTAKYFFTPLSGINDSIHYKYYIDTVLWNEGNSSVQLLSGGFGLKWTIKEFNRSLIQLTDSTYSYHYEPVIINPYASDTVGIMTPCIDCYEFFNVKTANGIQTHEDETSILIFPNPGNGTINISGLKMGQTYEIEIHDVLGKKLGEKNIIAETNKMKIDLSLSSGTYIIQVKNNQTIIREKIIIN